MKNTLAVQFNQVGKRYGDLEALKSVSFSIPKGSYFGLLGPNGAGKSTLINAMSGLIKPTSGSILVNGFDTEQNYRETRRALGLVPQELISDPFFSIKGLLTFQSGYFGLHGPEQDRWIDQLLERLALSDKADAMTSELSGGMKRRVLIAMSLVHRPEVIVLDEPTAGVDVELRKTLWDFTRELHRSGHTIILTTHYLEEAEALCEQIAILQKGELKELDSTSQLLSRHPFRYLRVQLEKPLAECGCQLHPELVERLDGQSSKELVFKTEKTMNLNQIMAWIGECGIPVADITSRDATLEEVFIGITEEKKNRISQESAE